jgi:hypothetical protein
MHEKMPRTEALKCGDSVGGLQLTERISSDAEKTL